MKRMIKILFFMFIGPGSVIFFIPYFILSFFGSSNLIKAGDLQYFGILPIIAGSIVSLWCSFDFIFIGKGTPVPTDPPKKLVVFGLYRFVRNPMYIGILILLFGEAVLFKSFILIYYTTFIFCLFQIFIIGFEEPSLHAQFGKEYEEYCNSVPRWIC
ncbi:MAG: isoprenylcysteine carboxylmethyltransferase family protein [Desulfobacteraceae bacterium]|nr:isoprenylcysteine carboxylmethyltransferase family protein [Desulfobacteraceae bacterium]